MPVEWQLAVGYLPAMPFQHQKIESFKLLLLLRVEKQS